MSEISTIADNALTYRGETVFTTETLAQMFGAQPENIRNNFFRNKDRFQSGTHYHSLAGGELREYKIHGLVGCGNRTSKVILWTAKSLGVHAKILDTPSAWRVMDAITEYQEILEALDGFEVPEDVPDMYVYAIRETETGRVKLGISRDPEARLRQLQTGNSQELELVAFRKAENRFDDEHALHSDARDYHLRGEWFDGQALETWH